MELHELLEQVRQGKVSVEQAEGLLRRSPFDELDFAKLDLHREIRSGFPEVVFCQGKRDEHLTAILRRLYESNGFVLGTRATPAQYALAAEILPRVGYDPVSRLLWVGELPQPQRGNIVVCTAGTADIPVAEEAARTAECFGRRVERIYDVGVSGLHRLLSRLDILQRANCIVAVAGMEGALASVIGGLVSCPVIAVPTSVATGRTWAACPPF